MGIFSEVLLPLVGLQSFVDYEANFTSTALFEYTQYERSFSARADLAGSLISGLWLARCLARRREHTELPIFAVAIYLTMIFYLPQHLVRAAGSTSGL